MISSGFSDLFIEGSSDVSILWETHYSQWIYSLWKLMILISFQQSFFLFVPNLFHPEPSFFKTSTYFVVKNGFYWKLLGTVFYHWYSLTAHLQFWRRNHLMHQPPVPCHHLFHLLSFLSQFFSFHKVPKSLRQSNFSSRDILSQHFLLTCKICFCRSYMYYPNEERKKRSCIQEKKIRDAVRVGTVQCGKNFEL